MAAIVIVRPAPSSADTLLDAIRLAYQTNPTLRGQEAELRATDEGYVQARAGYGPQVGVSGQVAYQAARVDQAASPFSPATTTAFAAETGSVDLSVSQPLYTGGAVAAQVRAARADVFAGREALRQTESQVILAVITAYVDVRRDRATATILESEIAALRSEADETEAKGRLGVVSKTDVALAQARLLSTQAQLSQAQGRLGASNAEYLDVIGQSPGDLEPEPDLAGTPASADDAFEAAEHNNPQVRQAEAAEAAARDQIDQAKAAYRPTVSFKIDAAVGPEANYLPHQYDRSVTGALVINQPLFTSGLNASKVREAADQDARAELNLESARRAAVQQVAQAWSQLAATRAAIALEIRQRAAEKTAAEGSRIEERAGLKSTFDMLNAETELADSEIALVQSRHDEYIARATLLAAMGLLEARYLSPGLETYHPERSLRRAEKVDAPVWEAGIAVIDGAGAPRTPEPRLAPPDAGDERPTDLPVSAGSPP